MFELIRKKIHLSERALAERAGVSRETLRRACNQDQSSCSLGTLDKIARGLGYTLNIVLAPTETCISSASTVAASVYVLRDGFNSWPIYFMDLVDTFRSTLDTRLILLPPVHDLDPKLRALLSGIVLELCMEVGMTAPDWAMIPQFLPSPWFVSDTQSLKAMALLESSPAFRRHNIFVLENFLKRA